MSFKAILALLLLVMPTAYASPPVEWMGAPDATAEYVDDPVFGGRVALYRAGARDAQAVLLVHGLGNNAARDWAKLIPALAARYHVIALDLPGFGHSDKGNHHYSPGNFARVLEGLLESRAQQPFALIGHSMGGTVALAYAAAHPRRVSRLVLVDVAGVLHRSVYAEFLAIVGAQRAMGVDSPWYESVVRAIQARAENWPVRADLVLERADVRQRVLRGDPSAISAVAMVEHDFSQGLRAITAPTLVIWGAEDLIAPLRTGQALASAIPHARLVTLEGVGHTPQLEVPLRFNPIVLDELDARPLAAPPYALPAGPVQDERAGRCDGRRDEEFSGDYRELVLENCADARISHARIGRLHVRHSTMRAVNSHIDAIESSNSRIELTGGTVGAGMTLDTTSVDAAATRFSPGNLASNAGAVPVVVRLSVVEVSRPGYAPRLLHDIFRLAPGETLVR
jgi:pimeloyl-ACP methyl ester carboxylesterase